jgi:tRNA(Ile)-lysidine synthase
MELIDEVSDSITRQGLLPRKSTCVVAVSGGLDSMCLLQVLSRLSSDAEWHLVVAHFNHQLRPDSIADEEFVRAEAGRVGLTFHSSSADVCAHAKAAGLSLEMAGRELRHRFLAEIAIRCGAQRVAVAHHRDDQVETIWLRLLRGVVAGLGGMRHQNPSPADPQVTLIRPLLEVSRAALVEFQKREGIPFREDLSNADARFQRNRLRHEVLPLLRRIQPEVDQATLRFAKVVSEENDFVARAASHWLRARDTDFATLHCAVQRAAVYQQLLKLGVRPEFDLIERLRVCPGEDFSCDSTHRIHRDPQGTVRVEEVSAPQFDIAKREVPLAARTVRVGALEFTWRIQPPQPIVPTAGQEVFDKEAIGDSIGMASPVKLQDLFTNLRIPPEARRKLVVAADAGGRIFWVESLRMSELHKVRSESAQVLVWKWGRIPSGPE